MGPNSPLLHKRGKTLKEKNVTEAILFFLVHFSGPPFKMISRSLCSADMTA